MAMNSLSHVDHYVISVLFLLCFRARLFIDTLWSPAGKGLNFWLSFVMSKCEVVTFHLYTGSGVVLGIFALVLDMHIFSFVYVWCHA